MLKNKILYKESSIHLYATHMLTVGEEDLFNFGRGFTTNKTSFFEDPFGHIDPEFTTTFTGSRSTIYDLYATNSYYQGEMIKTVSFDISADEVNHYIVRLDSMKGLQVVYFKTNRNPLITKEYLFETEDLYKQIPLYIDVVPPPFEWEDIIFIGN